MQLSTEQQRQLSHLLEVELESAQRLLDVLEQEHKALCGRDSELINQISETKLEQLKAFETQLSQRYRFLEELGIDSSKATLDPLFEKLGSSTLANQWQKLQQVAEKLQRQNEINGGIVVLSQHQIAMALDILTGQTGSASTYQRSGKTSGDKTSTRLVKA